MSKTVHVLPREGQWVVACEGREARAYATQREALENAKILVRKLASGQLVIHGVNGRIRGRATYGMPRIQEPPGRKSAKIRNAVRKLTRERLTGLLASRA